MILGFGNNVVSSLASDITASQTTFSVLPGDGPLFAALLTSDFSNKSTTLKNYAKITLTDSGETSFEVCHLTAVNGDTLTVIRGQEGTAAKGWALKDVVANFATRGSENSFPQIAHIQSGFYTSGTAGGTANALTLELPTTFFLNGSADWVLKTPIVVYPSQNNTGAATLQLTMGGRVLGTFKLYKGNKAELVANDILKDVALVCLLDNTKTFFNVANPGAIYAGLGTAAFRDVQTSKDDVTVGRVLVNGGALALRTVLAGAGRPVTDFDDLPENAVSFGYDNATNTPGFTGSVLDYAGSSGRYRVQLAAQYNGNGNRIAFRTRNGDAAGVWNPWGELYHTRNKPTAGDVGAVAKAGDTMTGALTVPGVINTADYHLRNSVNRHLRFEYLKNDGTWAVDGYVYKDGVDAPNRRPGVRINCGTPNKDKGNASGSGDWVFGEDGMLTCPGEITGAYKGTFMWNDQYNTKAPFYHDFNTAGASEYHPLIKQRARLSNNAWVFTQGVLVSGVDLTWHLYMRGSAGQDFRHQWDTKGNYNCPGQVIPGNYANFDARYPTLFRVGARIKVGNLHATGDWSGKVPQGALSIASLTEGDDRITSMYYAYPQYLINGKWVNFA